MSFNVLNLPDGSIEGHKYCQGRTANLTGSGAYTLTSATPFTWTATHDGIFTVGIKKSGAGNTAFIDVNDVDTAIYVSYTANNYGVLQVPVRKGDSLKVRCDGNTWTIEFCYLIKYR